MNEFPEPTDLQKLYDAVQCIRKTISCSVCEKEPTEANAAKCGHPFCKKCGEKILNFKKAQCSICKVPIMRSAVYSVKSIDKIVTDLISLCAAIEKDSKAPNQVRQYQGKGKILTLPGPSISKIGQEDSLKSDLSRDKSEKQDRERQLMVKKVIRKKSIESEETIKISKGIQSERSRSPSAATRSLSKRTNIICEPVFTADNLANKIGTIGTVEKVAGWLNSEEFEGDRETETDIVEPPSLNSTPFTEILESHSQVKQDSGESTKSGRNSRISQTPEKNEYNQKTLSTTDSEQKFKSFTFEATDKKKQNISKLPTPAEKMFDDLQRKTVKEQADNKKLRGPSVSTDDSWSDLARLKKEAHSKVRKRRRLNVSIEKPSSNKPVVESFDPENSKDRVSSNVTLDDEKNKSTESNKDISVEGSVKKGRKVTIVSYRNLEPSEMIDIPKLNKHQVKEIIGVLDVSKTSSNSPEKSSIILNRNKLSLRRSGEPSLDNTNKEETTSNFGESSRPQSKQSFHVNDSRPSSRLSCTSTGKRTSEKYRLSTGKRSSMPTTGLEATANPNLIQQIKEDQEKVQLPSDSPVRVSNNTIRNKLSLKRSSSASSKTTDRENRFSANVPIKKMGKLHKIRNRIKFVLLGSIQSKPEKRELIISTRDAMTQTNPLPANTNSACSCANRKELSSESMGCVIIPETRTVSAVSTDSRKIQTVQPTSSSTKSVTLQESPEEFDTVNKVNMLSPEKDSQLKFLATKSPSVPRMSSVNSAQNMSKYSLPMKENSFTNLSVGTSGHEEYLRAVKKCGEELIVTDSEDQDTPYENIKRIKRRINHGAGRNELDKAIPSPTTSFISKTTSSLSGIKIDDKIEALASCGVTGIEKSPSLHSVGNNSGGNRFRASPRNKRYSKDSLGSQTKRRNVEKASSPTKTSDNYCEATLESDTKTVMLFNSKSKDIDQDSEASKASTINTKHKVVRELKYSQESGPKPNSGSGRSESSEQQTAEDKEIKNNCITGKKTFQMRRRISSTDSDDALVVSLATKQSSNNSQAIQRPRLSQELIRSPILSEDMTVVFSSNKDTQESKRKRSPSPNPLDNHALQTIASTWCADHSSEEIVVDNEKVSKTATELSSYETPLKKPRVAVQNSPASLHSENFPAMSPTAIYGKSIKSNNVIDTIAEVNNQSSFNGEDVLSNDLDKAAAQFDGIDAQIDSERSVHLLSEANSVPATHPSHVNVARNIECSIKRGNTFSGIVTTSKISTPAKAKSLEDRTLSLVFPQSQNSDKENELLGNQSVKKRAGNKRILSRTGQKIIASEVGCDLQVDSGSEKSETGNAPKPNFKNVSNKTESTNDSDPIETSFDRDCLNITQEQILMQELEDNLLGRKSKNTTNINTHEARQGKTAVKSPNENKDKNLSVNETVTSTVNEKAIGQHNSDSSDTMDEDIIESTPERNLALRKDLYAEADSSQRLNVSPKSFMSADMTPISKTQASMLSKAVSIPLTINRGVPRRLIAGPSCHSTPKPTISVTRKTACVGRVRNQNEKLCFVCSCLSLPEVETVKAFARKHDAEFTASYKPEVTHVIVETKDSDSAGRTLKYLLGVAHKKWIVSFRWVADSLSQGKILDESDYEAVDSETEEPGPRRSRLSNKGLFEEFAFVFMKPFSDITIDQLQDLITSSGGTVFETLEDLASTTNKYKLILYNGDNHGPDLLEKWEKRGKALPVQMEWVLACISQYDHVSLHDYLHALVIELLPKYNLPAKLVTEEEDSCSGDETSTLNNA